MTRSPLDPPAPRICVAPSGGRFHFLPSRSMGLTSRMGPFRVFLLCLVLVTRAGADVPLPPNVLNPVSVPEAWNVIRLTRANVARLLQEKRLAEVPEQVSLCSPALRFLARAHVPEAQRAMVDEQSAAAFRGVNAVAQAAMVRSQPDADRSLAVLEKSLAAIEAGFDENDVHAEIYYCPAHPDVIATTAGVKCRKCNAPLRLRRIPYSFTYVTPGAPTVKLTAHPETTALEAGKQASVTIELRTLDGAPLGEEDFIVVHGKPVHLLISDAALEEFQVVHPVAGQERGVFKFTFTPRKGGAHRVWADVTPVATGLQELPIADIGGGYTPVAAKDTSEELNADAGGFHFQFAFSIGNGGQARAHDTQLIRVNITEPDGKPVQRLEPVMNAFAHIAGIYDDHRTLVRLHPTGGDILRDDLRGGPFLGFKFYAPRAGYVRWFLLVRIDGKDVTVPFAANVVD